MSTLQRLNKANTETRRDILKTFLGSDNHYHFDSRHVCITFLKEGFHFSTVMIAEVSSGKISRPFTSRSSSSRRVQSVQSDTVTSLTLGSTTSDSESQSEVVLKKKKEAVISFVERLAEDCGDSMPHRPDIHIPFYQIQEVYPIFTREFKKLYPTIKPASKSYFRRTWQLFCPHVRVSKTHRFSICDVCDSIRTQLRNRILYGESTAEIRSRRSAHLSFVTRERTTYQKKKDRGRLVSSEYCSLIIDGADQTAFGLPHFTTATKAQRGHAMKVKLVGLLEHRLQTRLTLMTMTQEHQTGSNHVIEVLHRFLDRKRKEGPLPKNLFVQLDNCSRENKNKYVMGYLELLVATSVFDSVECGFLPVGHTHEDVDQAFSTTASRLRVTDAITLDDMHEVLSTTYGGHVHVERLLRVANFSGLCDSTRCLKKIDKITQWRYFLFVSETAKDPSVKERGCSTTCYVKKNSDDEWQHLFPSSARSFRAGILRECPDLGKTPPTKIDCPDGLAEVNKLLCQTTLVGGRAHS